MQENSQQTDRSSDIQKYIIINFASRDDSCSWTALQFDKTYIKINRTTENEKGTKFIYKVERMECSQSDTSRTDRIVNARG